MARQICFRSGRSTLDTVFDKVILDEEKPSAVAVRTLAAFVLFVSLVAPEFQYPGTETVFAVVQFQVIQAVRRALMSVAMATCWYCVVHKVTALTDVW